MWSRYTQRDTRGKEGIYFYIDISSGGLIHRKN